MSTKKTICLLGGEGFIGRNLIDTLHDDFTLISLDQQRSAFSYPVTWATFVEGNPYEAAVDVVADILIHLVDPGGDAVFDAAREQKMLGHFAQQPAHIILFSSAAVYAAPDAAYGHRKAALEKFYQDYCARSGIALTILRVFNTFGPYQTPGRPGALIANLLNDYCAGRTTNITDAQSERDFIAATDLGHFVAHVIIHKKYDTYDVGSGMLTSIAGLIEIIENDVLRDKLKITAHGKNDGVTSPAAKDDFGGAVSVTPLKTALAKAYAFYEKNS